jgi:hypothetical protein
MRIKGVHFVDTSILATLVFNDPDEKDCLRYLKRIPKVYNGNISLLVLGELYLSLLDNFTDNLERTEAFQIINGLIQHLDFNYVTLEISHYLYCVRKIKRYDSRLDITDTKLLAEALGSNCSAFVTIDDKILKSMKISSLIKTVHPEEMI